MGDEGATPASGVTGFSVEPEMHDLMIAVAATLATAQALEVTLVALVTVIDRRTEIGGSIDDLKKRTDTMLADPLGNLITKLGQASRARPEDLQFLRDLKERRNEFVHHFCTRPTFLQGSRTPEGREALIQELWKLSADLEATRHQAASYAVITADTRFGLSKEAILEDLAALATGARGSRVLSEDVATMLQDPDVQEKGRRIIEQLLERPNT